MVELTELDGVAEGRAENLTEAGYESVEDLVDADPETVADEVSYLPEDTALELIVQAQNIVAEEDAEVEESEPESVTNEVAEAVSAEEALDELPDEEEIEEEVEGEPKEEPETIDEESDEEEVSDTADETDESVDESPEDISFELTFDEALEFDTFFDAVMGQRATMLRSNRSGIDAFDHTLDQLRSSGGVGATVELKMEPQELNDLHNCVRQTMIAYKGDNLIDHMDALKSVMTDINAVRDEHLF